MLDGLYPGRHTALDDGECRGLVEDRSLRCERGRHLDVQPEEEQPVHVGMREVEVGIWVDVVGEVDQGIWG